jgi:Ice-binding-like/Bacterial Ig-like domain
MNKYGTGFKARTWLMAAVLAGFTAGCGDGIFGGGGAGTGGIPGAPPGAIIPGAACTVAGAGIPTVTSSNPTNGNQFVTTSTTGVAASGKLITATFSLAMNSATINSPLLTFSLKETISGTNVGGAVAMNAAGTMATLTTSAALSPGTQYTATITQAATSAAVPGVPLGCIVAWSFKTGAVATGLAPINLGLATPFAIAATAGVTNTPTAPITHIEGDVVLVSTPTCNTVLVPGGPGTAGFGLCTLPPSVPPTLNGTVITPTVPDATTATAVMADFTAGFNSTCQPGLPVAACSLATGTVIGAIGGVAGSALVPNVNLFTPGVYSSASSIGITGDITLDAQGDQNAVFIFQSGSTLDLAAGAAPPMVVSPASGTHSRVLLVNGAKASNVWWSVGSAATLGLYSEMQGNVLAYGTIVMKTGATSCGRLLAGASGAGQFTFDNNIVSVPGKPFTPPATYSPTCQ